MLMFITVDIFVQFADVSHPIHTHMSHLMTEWLNSMDISSKSHIQEQGRHRFINTKNTKSKEKKVIQQEDSRPGLLSAVTISSACFRSKLQSIVF